MKRLNRCYHKKSFTNNYGVNSFVGKCELDDSFCDEIGPCRHKFFCPVCNKWFYSKRNVKNERGSCPKCGSIVGIM